MVCLQDAIRNLTTHIHVNRFTEAISILERSQKNILTTHTGSLPRSTALQELLKSQLDPSADDQEHFEKTVETEICNVVERQIAPGIDIINDGAQGRIQYVSYVKDRLTGFE